MAKTADTGKLADIDSPAREKPQPRDRLPRDQRTVAPTPEAHKTGQSAQDENVADLARRATAEQAASAKDAAAMRAAEEAERVREAGESFDPGSFAHHASEHIADNLSAAARSIESTDLNHVAADVADFARRQPLLFFGGAALLGFAAGRALKASERAEHDTVDPSFRDARVAR